MIEQVTITENIEIQDRPMLKLTTLPYSKGHDSHIPKTG